MASMDSNVRNIYENQESQDSCLSHWRIVVWGYIFLMYFLEFIKSFIALKEILDQSSHENLSCGQDIATSGSYYLKEEKCVCMRFPSINTKYHERIKIRIHILNIRFFFIFRLIVTFMSS